MSQPEPNETPTRPKAARLVPILCLVAGVGLGILVMVAVSRQMDPAQTLEVKTGPPPESLPPLVARKEKQDPPPPAGWPPNQAFPEQFNVGANAGLGPKPAETPSVSDPNAKVDPGVGAPPTLSGSLPGGVPGGSEPVKPIVLDGEKNAALPVTYTEFQSIVFELDVEPTIEKIRRRVQAAGGQVRFEFERDPDRVEAGRDLLIGVPRAAAEKLREDLGKLADGQEMDRWNGPFSERHFRMERFLRDAAGRVEARLSELKVKYHDDAPLVVRTAQLLDRIQKAMKAFGPVPVEQEAFRVYVGKSATGWP